VDFAGIIQRRRSVREFSKQAISRKELEKIVDAARFAPTARNVQPWEFVVVTDHAVLLKVAALADNGKFIADAAACIAVFCSDTKYYLEDGVAATENILLMATALGIGSCWVAGDKKPYCSTVADLLHVPSTYKLVSLIALGYPQDKDALRPAEKRTLQELIHWDHF
jgi:nitroreductase